MQATRQVIKLMMLIERLNNIIRARQQLHQAMGSKPFSPRDIFACGGYKQAEEFGLLDAYADAWGPAFHRDPKNWNLKWAHLITG
jgi:hypothetical protein